MVKQLTKRRRTARIILIDDSGRVLLFRGGDPARPGAGSWWFTPGGAVAPGESAEAAARRELKEETGLPVKSLGQVVLQRHVNHEFEGVHYSQEEDYFLVRCAAFEISDVGWTASERRVIEEHRWWPGEELRTTRDAVYPEGLLAFLDSLAATSERVQVCLFCAICAGKSQSPLIYSDDQLVVIEPTEKSSPIHVLIVPRRHLASIDSLVQPDAGLWWHMLEVAQRLARDLGMDVDGEGYHVVANAGRHSTRQFPHLHLHLASGALE
jgi:8-oxo-dGTP pyrophosphatase MutT (NUDIX family)/diadenosine tetraphosphate (Ap4A) HIT family hydrolase